MAGRMLETMAGELTKLREEVVRIKAIDVTHNLSKFKMEKAAAQVEGGGGGEEQAKEAINFGGAEKAKSNPKSFMEKEEEEDGLLSESTVCLLIDRFVPC